MKLIPAVIAACLYGSLGSALAVQTFDLVLSGEAHNVPSGGAAAGLLYGAAQVKLADGGDGNYVGGNLISIDLWANFSGVIPGMFGSAFHFSTTGNALNAFGVIPSATIAGGQLTDVRAAWNDFSTSVLMSPEFHVQVIDWSGGFRDTDPHPYVAANGVLAAIPEPETYALMWGGLAVLGFVARRKNQAVVRAGTS